LRVDLSLNRGIYSSLATTKENRRKAKVIKEIQKNAATEVVSALKSGATDAVREFLLESHASSGMMVSTASLSVAAPLAPVSLQGPTVEEVEEVIAAPTESMRSVPVSPSLYSPHITGVDTSESPPLNASTLEGRLSTSNAVSSIARTFPTVEVTPQIASSSSTVSVGVTPDVAQSLALTAILDDPATQPPAPKRRKVAPSGAQVHVNGVIAGKESVKPVGTKRAVDWEWCGVHAPEIAKLRTAIMFGDKMHKGHSLPDANGASFSLIDLVKEFDIDQSSKSHTNATTWISQVLVLFGLPWRDTLPQELAANNAEIIQQVWKFFQKYIVPYAAPELKAKPPAYFQDFTAFTKTVTQRFTDWRSSWTGPKKKAFLTQVSSL
jgi:hypothetical protein